MKKSQLFIWVLTGVVLVSCTEEKEKVEELAQSAGGNSGASDLVPAKLEVSGANSDIEESQCLALTLKVLNKSGREVPARTAMEAFLTMTGQGRSYSDSNCTTVTEKLVVNLGSSRKDFYFKSSEFENSQLSIVSRGLTGAQWNYRVLSRAKALSLEISETGRIDKCQKAVIKSLSASGVEARVASDTKVQLVSASAARDLTFYNDINCVTAVQLVQIDQKKSQTSFYLKSQKAGSYPITASSTNLSPSSKSYQIYGFDIAIQAQRPLIQTHHIKALDLGLSGDPLKQSHPGSSSARVKTALEKPFEVKESEVGAEEKFSEIHSKQSAPVDLTSNYGVQIDVSANYPPNATVVCEALTPYQEIGCELKGFVVKVWSFLKEQPFKVRLFEKGGRAIDSAESGELALDVLEVRQISKLSTTIQPHWTILGTKLFFRALSFAAKDKLFYYDDEAVKIRQLTDLTGESGNDGISILGTHDDEIYFRSRNNPSQRKTKLFRYNLKNDELSAVTEIYSNGDENPSFWASDKESVYFTAVADRGVSKIYRFEPGADSKKTRLTQVSNLAGDAWSDQPSDLLKTDDALFFVGSDTSGLKKIYRIGNGSTTVQWVSNTAGENRSDEPFGLEFVNGDLYFAAKNTEGADKLYVLRKSSNVVERLSNLSGDLKVGDRLSQLFVSDESIYFVSNNKQSYSKLYRYSLEQKNFLQISNTAGSQEDDQPGNFLAQDGKIYFTSNLKMGVRKLFVYDTKSGETSLLSQTRGADDQSDDPEGLTSYGGKIFFTALNALGVAKMMVYDPATSTTGQVSRTSGSDKVSDGISMIGLMNNKLFFTAKTASGSTELHSVCFRSLGCGE